MPPARYLNKILHVELDWLDEEVSIPNPQASYDYVLGQCPWSWHGRGRCSTLAFLHQAAYRIV